VLLGLDDELRTTVAMAEAPHGTAPALEGKDVANPMAMILAGAAVLHYAGEEGRDPTAEGTDDPAEVASQAIYDAVMDATAAGIRTSDLGGHAGTTEFTDAVVERVGERLD
jgi:isocitrate/isopropylmalate dehydrogenase